MSFQYKYNHTLVKFSKSNRKAQTDAEKLLWFHLRDRQLEGYKFRRQYPINNYIIDFYCAERNLAIELDGSQHIKNKLYDIERTQHLQNLGIQLVRFWDNDVLKNISGVLERIITIIRKDTIIEPHPNPLLKGEGK